MKTPLLPCVKWIAAGLLMVSTAAAAGELQLIVGATGVADEFGYAVSADNNLMLAGAPGEADQTGAAYVFRCGGGRCIQEARLSDLTLDPGHHFGHDVAVAGADLFVSAPDQNGGVVYAFNRAAQGVVVPVAALVALDGEPLDRFGTALAVDADTLVIGAPGDNDNRGAVFVFVRDGGSWVQQFELYAWDGLAGDGFGMAVAVQGDRISVGAPFDGGLGAGSPYARGAVYTFTRANGLWSPEAKLVSSTAQNGDLFGRSVALSATRLVVGTPGAASGLGRVFWFERPSGSWAPAGNTGPPTPIAKQRFGWNLELNGNDVWVGAPFTALNTNPSCGAFVLLRDTAGTLSPATVPALRNPLPGDMTGWRLAAWGSYLYAAAPGRNISLEQQGAVAWFDAVDQIADGSFEESIACP
ncbi:hypothetical protein C7S18_15025 [Ahniella affigens]|uniref:Integrin n=1 Tax=Ahniella affigens TaxID=2021234 RepID=A0A2P1PUB9_9GAMM|nr:FG-GAP repeat protein [Ahniella affigens]AVP98420.1 hypothetical protein C7S18_15025 [Ahniella affigens]